MAARNERDKTNRKTQNTKPAAPFDISKKHSYIVWFWDRARFDNDVNEMMICFGAASSCLKEPLPNENKQQYF